MRGGGLQALKEALKVTHILEGPVHLDFSDKHGGDVFKRPELLLHPPIPTSLYRVNPRNLEGQSWWNEVRRDAYAENDFHCFACGCHQLDVKGSQNWLEAHECYDYDWELREITFREVVALCPYCHKFIHFIGIISKEYLGDVLEHGLLVLAEARMQLPDAQLSMAKLLYPERFPLLRDVSAQANREHRHKLVQLMNYAWLLNYGGKQYDWRSAPPKPGDSSSPYE